MYAMVLLLGSGSRQSRCCVSWLATDTNWQCYVSNGSAAGQFVNSGVAIDGNLHTFDMIINANGSITFGIDGVVVATVTPTTALTTAYELAGQRITIRQRSNAFRNRSSVRLHFRDISS